MILLAAFVASVCAAAVMLAGTRPFFARTLFTRQNYRGVELPTAVGLIVPLSVVAVLAGALVVSTLGWRAHLATLESLGLTATVCLGFGFLGLLDDLAIDHETSGYRGHIQALRHGNLSAGALKMLIGPLVALVAVFPASGGSFWRLLADGALVALAANLANLLDRAPGRVSKVVLLIAAGMALTSAASPALAGLAAVAGAAVVLLRPDLREKVMLGDAGANPMGAAAGLAAVLAFTPATRIVILAVLVGLNLLSEWVSFSRVIDRTAPLRFVDRLGRGE
jgi:UDP-N-acetylmuramyl pentapeptide phosphotransferase/UDP-N-acetylglucosamine-1-phosphate transferase